MKLKIILSTIILFFSNSFAQIDLTTGITFGGGAFSGNSTSVGGFTTSFFLEPEIPLFEEVFPRASFIFAKDFNAILPNTNKVYLPFLAGVNLKGITTQYFDSKIFLEEGVGLTALNDRTFIDTNVWDYGIVLSFAAGFDLRNFDLKGFRIGAGVEYAITFFNTLPQYTSVHVVVYYTL